MTEKQQEAVLKLAEEVGIDLKDRRSVSSPENGQKGGRPSIPYPFLNEKFLEEKYPKQDGFYTLACLNEQYFSFDGGCWRNKAFHDLEAEAVRFLQGFIEVRANTIKDFFVNLKAFVALDSGKIKIPCFLPDGKNAAGWLPMQNTIVNVEELAMAIGEGRPIPETATMNATPRLFCTYCLPYSFIPEAVCPEFDAFLAGVQPDEENRRILQMMAGLCLVPRCETNTFFILYGESGTGKSQFLNILKYLLGEENCSAVPLENFADQYSLLPLSKTLANIVPEMSADFTTLRRSIGLLKQITAGEEIYCNIKFSAPVMAQATARLVFGTNEFPILPERSNGIWNRLRVIPFSQIFRNTGKEIVDIGKKIAEKEGAGIFNWALRGLYELMKLDYKFPECTAGQSVKDEQRLTVDHELEFLMEFTEYSPGSWLPTMDFYNRFVQWTRDCGFRQSTINSLITATLRHYPDVKKFQKRTGLKRERGLQNIKLTY